MAGASEINASTTQASSRATNNRRRWATLAAAILLTGLAISLLSGVAWRSSVQKHEAQAFQTSSTDVTETLETMLNRDTDFVAGLRSVLTMQPHLSATGFDQWYTGLEGKRRQVGSLGSNVMVSVPASELAAFQARRNVDPAFRALIGNKVVAVKTKGRARYCLLSAGGTVVPYTPTVTRLLQGDWCDPNSPIGSYKDGAATQATITRVATDTGQFVVYPVNAQGVQTLFLETAFYRQGAKLRTTAQRRAAVAGWIASSFDVSTLIHSALRSYKHMGVSLYHANPGGPMELVGRDGTAGGDTPYSHSAALELNGRWLAVARGTTPTGGLSANAQGLLVFVAGALVSALLSALVLVLSRSREKALALVDEKTGELRHQALHDALTGLPNRVLTIDRAEQMLARARRRQIPVAALYVDVDGFKHVNDTFGHAAGDELLRMVAERLSSVVREGDTAGRLGGDEFVVLVEGSRLDAGPELVAERLLDVLRQPYDMSGDVRRCLSITASVGVAMGVRESADNLLNDADLALYEAKAAGKNRYMIFESDMHAAAHDRMELEMDLNEALGDEELFLLYQPLFDLRSERVIGVEALLRWRHPARGVVSPVVFIPIAEESGQIVPIGRWVLHTACEQTAEWRRKGSKIGVSVNVSARQLDHDDLIEDVSSALESSGLDPAALTLEITETTLMRDAHATARRLAELKELGVRLAIDDFGTGYSSLAYLRQFPVDALKIDRSFISEIAGSKQSTALIHTLVQLGKTLHLETLAEGIEEQTQLRTLQREHCDLGQGFLFARPLEVPAIEEFLDTEGEQAGPGVRSHSSATS